MNIEARYKEIVKKVPEGVNIVAISKTHPPESIIELYQLGHRHFGESKAQELAGKYEELKDYDIKWHMVGHLQRNKVKYIAPFVSLIHSVDSFRLLKEINKQAKKNNRTIDCLLQFHIAEEPSKFGFNLDNCKDMLNSDEFNNLENINICGVMGMATFTEDENLIRSEFKKLSSFFLELKNHYFADSIFFKEMSFGMTGDWEIALSEGSTMLRIGTLIFGSR